MTRPGESMSTTLYAKMVEVAWASRVPGSAPRVVLSDPPRVGAPPAAGAACAAGALVAGAAAAVGAAAGAVVGLAAATGAAGFAASVGFAASAGLGTSVGFGASAGFAAGAAAGAELQALSNGSRPAVVSALARKRRRVRRIGLIQTSTMTLLPCCGCSIGRRCGSGTCRTRLCGSLIGWPGPQCNVHCAQRPGGRWRRPARSAGQDTTHAQIPY